jgi:hypothetical protein
MTSRARPERGRRSTRTAAFRAHRFPANWFVVTMISALVQASLLAACGAAGDHSSAGAATRQVRLSPVNGTGAPAAGFRVASTAAKATCEAGSEAIGQAYRCFAGNAIYDPCWAEKAATPIVLCLPYPWARTDVRLLVRGPLGALPSEGGSPGTGEPWGVQLASGQRCLLAQGAHTEFAGRVIDYYCSTRFWLLRGLSERSAVWRAGSVIASKSGKLTRGPEQAITIAWFGRPDTSR